MNETLAIKGSGSGLFAQESMFEPEPAPERARPAFRRQATQPKKAPGASLMSKEQAALLRTMITERASNPAVIPIRERLNRCREGGMLTTGVFSECYAALKGIRRDETPAEAPSADVDFPIWLGRYTLEKSDGHRTFRVDLIPADSDFAPGEVVIEYLSGQNNSSDYTRFGFVKSGPKVNVWKRHRDNAALMEDVEQFVAIWKTHAAKGLDAVDFFEALADDGVLATRRCARCGEDLSVPTSVRQGFGPVCVTKGLH